MTEALSTELYRQGGPEFRSVRLTVEPDGSIRLNAQPFTTTWLWRIGSLVRERGCREQLRVREIPRERPQLVVQVDPVPR